MGLMQGWNTVNSEKPTLANVLRGAWAYRFLLFPLAGRAVRKSCMRTVLGWSWIPIRCLLPVIMGTLLFGSILNGDGGGMPFFLFILSGTIPWTLFAMSIVWTIRCVELNRKLVSLVYFPRVLLPFAFSSPALVDSLILQAVYLAAAFYCWLKGVDLFFPGTVYQGLVFLWSVLGALLLGISLGAILAIPAACARDFRFMARYATSLIYFVTPIVFPPTKYPETLGWVRYANPIVGFVEGYRFGVNGVDICPIDVLLSSSFITLLLSAIMIYVFVINDRRMSTVV